MGNQALDGRISVSRIYRKLALFEFRNGGMGAEGLDTLLVCNFSLLLEHIARGLNVTFARGLKM